MKVNKEPLSPSPVDRAIYHQVSRGVKGQIRRAVDMVDTRDPPEECWDQVWDQVEQDILRSFPL